jgi:rubrerythrin
MPLINFGSILNFAEELEQGDHDFYSTLIQNPECIRDKEIYDTFSTDAKKNVKTVQRTRRENVTEMILEPIVDFTRAPYTIEYGKAETLNVDEAMELASKLEERAKRYYTEAAEKIKALPEVARILKLLAKKRQAHLGMLKPR